MVNVLALSPVVVIPVPPSALTVPFAKLAVPVSPVTEPEPFSIAASSSSRASLTVEPSVMTSPAKLPRSVSPSEMPIA